MNSSIKAIFFDIGGTLRVTREGGRDLSKITELMYLLGEKSDRDTFIARIHKGEKAYRRWCKPNYIELCEADLWTRFLTPEYPADFIRKNAIIFNQLWRDSKPKFVLPDMVETIKSLHQRGYRLGLISNTTSSVEGHSMLAELDLTNLFSTVILSAGYGRRKPHPSIFLDASREAGVFPEECVYVGDRPSRDLIGARQAGYAEVVIIKADGYFLDDYDPDDYDPEKDTELKIKPDHWIRKLKELLDFYPDRGIENPVKVYHQASQFKKYEVALSTMWGVDQPTSFSQTFRQGVEAGFVRFELNHAVTVRMLAENDINRFYISTIHEPCPADFSYDEMKQKEWLISSPEESNRVRGVDSIKHSVEVAVELGAKSIVVHPGSILCDRSLDRKLRELFNLGKQNSIEYEELKTEMIKHREASKGGYIESVVKSLHELIAFTRGSGVSLGLENRYRYYDIPLPDEMEAFLHLCNENWFGFQLDTGHAFTLERLGLVQPEEWLTRFGSRIIGIHLHDVIGIMDHQVPGLGEIDFSRLSKFLPEYCLKTLEVSPQAKMDEIKTCLDYLVKRGVINEL